MNALGFNFALGAAGKSAPELLVLMTVLVKLLQIDTPRPFGRNLFSKAEEKWRFQGALAVRTRKLSAIA